LGRFPLVSGNSPGWRATDACWKRWGTPAERLGVELSPERRPPQIRRLRVLFDTGLEMARNFDHHKALTVPGVDVSATLNTAEVARATNSLCGFPAESVLRPRFRGISLESQRPLTVW
jgi:hypothetical protein